METIGSSLILGKGNLWTTPIQRRFLAGFIAVITLTGFLITPSRAADHKPTIHVGLPRSMPPFAFVDTGLRAYRGFCVDLTVMAGRLMKSEVKFHAYDNNSLIAALVNGQVDIVCCTLLRPESENAFKLINTGIRVDRNLFVNNSCVTVTCLKDTLGHSVVVEKDRRREIQTFIPPGVSIVETASSEEALEILNKGLAHVYISPSTLTTLYLIQKNGFQNIKLTGMPIETVPLSFAVRKDRIDLLSDLSLTLGKIGNSPNYQQIKKKWLGSGIEVNVWNKYVKYVVMALACLAAVLLIFAGWNFTLKRRVQRMTRELSYSEQKYRELIESSNEMIQIISGDGDLKLTNKITLDLLAQGDKDLTGKNMTELVVPEQKSEMKAFIGSLFERGYGEKEFVFQAGDGTRIPIEMIATTISDSGQPKGLASCFSRDIRVRKRLEEELIRSDRLAILGKISAGLAHEINNPLGIILANAQDLLGEPMDEMSRRQGLDTIVKNTERASHIVNDLLAFTRQGPLIKAPVNLIDVIEESLIFVHSKVKAKKILIRKEVPAGGTVVFGDERQLMQLMVNLLLNSIQVLTINGLITIRVSTRNSNHREEVLLEVEDNGPGIKPADLKRVFDPFYTTKETGFGLGLFISSTIVERHQGSIWAESQEGCSTTMRVLLPSLSAEAERHDSGGNNG
ncbi:MAG: transporter substrate-binding domain-containing protein [Deltaproteobacteria bacterium]|nr:transporter substrate-binding domain-containing protein [Deltaproteobacteria bacterium]